jgi:hypothetical protein
VRYRRGDIEVDIYHGRQSYEIEFGIAYEGIRYSLSEVIRVTDADADKQYRVDAATNPEGVEKGLTELETLARRFSERVLRGDPEFIAALEKGRQAWLKE